MYERLKDQKDGMEENDQGIRKYQKLQGDVYKDSKRTSENEKNYIKISMVVLDADKERMKELEERFEEITPTYQKSQKKKKKENMTG